MQTDRWNRLRAWTGGFGESMPRPERFCSSQTRAMLWAAEAVFRKPKSETIRSSLVNLFIGYNEWMLAHLRQNASENIRTIQLVCNNTEEITHAASAAFPRPCLVPRGPES